MLLNFGLGVVQVNLGGLGEHFRSTGRILDDQVRHYAHCSHFVETAGHQVEEFLVSGILHQIRASLELVSHGFHTLQQRLHLL